MKIFPNEFVCLGFTESLHWLMAEETWFMEGTESTTNAEIKLYSQIIHACINNQMNHDSPPYIAQCH